jgi:hypothetical protein
MKRPWSASPFPHNITNRAVILSERSESKDLRLLFKAVHVSFIMACQEELECKPLRSAPISSMMSL